MAGLIPQNFIDDLISRSDIVEVINSRVPLKRKGKEYTACCPFHEERTPSFKVHPGRGTWHCFGACARGGAHSAAGAGSGVASITNLAAGAKVFITNGDRIKVDTRSGEYQERV